MAVFPGSQWAEALVKQIKDNEDYKEFAKDWEGTILLTIRSEPGLSEKDFHIWLDPYRGDIREMKVVDDPSSVEADFVLGAPYSTFKQIIKQELAPIKAMMAGKIKVQGKMSYLLKHVKAAQSLLTILNEVDTQFIDEQ